MKLSTVQKAFVALIIANTLWGAGNPIFKIALTNVPLFTLAFYRFFWGAILVLIVFRKHVGFNVQQRKDYLLLLAYALFGITFNIIFFFMGLERTLAINGGVLTASAPIMTFFFAMTILRERFSLHKLFGMLLGASGIILIILEPILKKGLDGSVVGNVFLLLATFGAVISTLVGRDIAKRYHPAMITFWAFVIGSASFLPLAIKDYVANPLLYHSLDLRGYVGIAWGAIASSAIAYSLFAWGLSKISATDTAMFMYIDPIAAAVLSVILLHEPITGLFLLGTFFTFGGITIAEGRLHYHPFWKLRTPPIVPSLETPSSPKKTAQSARVLEKLFKNQNN